MHKILLMSGLLFFISGYCQTDTLFTRKQQKISCRIIEINDADIKYKRSELPDGPVYVISKTKVIKYTMANGFTEMVVPDEFSIEGQHAGIMHRRTVIKLHPFSIINNQISLSFETVLKVGMNLEAEVGYIKNSLNQNPLFGKLVYPFNGVSYSGAFVKPGLKLLLGHEYDVKSMKYAHPLKGRYIRLDLAFAYMSFENMNLYTKASHPGPSPVTISTNLNTMAYGAFVNYGRQFILANLLTVDYYLGLGFTAQSHSYSNPEYINSWNPGSDTEVLDISNYHGFVRTPGVGLSYTAGFRIGYIFPKKRPEHGG